MRVSPWTYGSWGGLAVIVYFLILYLVDPFLLIDPRWYWGSYAIYLIVMILYSIHRRKQGLLKMRAVTNGGFRVFLMISILYYIFYYLLYTYIDPELLTLYKESIFNVRDELMREQLKNSLEDAGEGIQMSSLLLKFAGNLIFGFILAAFLAPVFKRDKI